MCCRRSCPRERQSCSCDIHNPYAGPMCGSRGVAIWPLAGVADRFTEVAIGPEGVSGLQLRSVGEPNRSRRPSIISSPAFRLIAGNSSMMLSSSDQEPHGTTQSIG
jgi:hypothetical protein